MHIFTQYVPVSTFVMVSDTTVMYCGEAGYISHFYVHAAKVMFTAPRVHYTPEIQGSVYIPDYTYCLSSIYQQVVQSTFYHMMKAVS